jgi:hypothetical protein
MGTLRSFEGYVFLISKFVRFNRGQHLLGPELTELRFEELFLLVVIRITGDSLGQAASLGHCHLEKVQIDLLALDV